MVMILESIINLSSNYTKCNHLEEEAEKVKATKTKKMKTRILLKSKLQALSKTYYPTGIPETDPKQQIQKNKNKTLLNSQLSLLTKSLDKKAIQLASLKKIYFKTEKKFSNSPYKKSKPLYKSRFSITNLHLRKKSNNLFTNNHIKNNSNHNNTKHRYKKPNPKIMLINN